MSIHVAFVFFFFLVYLCARMCVPQEGKREHSIYILYKKRIIIRRRIKQKRKRKRESK